MFYGFIYHRGGQKVHTDRVAIPVGDNIFKWMYFVLIQRTGIVSCILPRREGHVI